MLTNFLSDVGALPSSSLSMLVLLVKATVILVAALGATLAMQRASAGARHLVWLVALGTLLVVPALAAWAPLRFRILPPATATPSTPRGPATADVRGDAPSTTLRIDDNAAANSTPVTPAGGVTGETDRPSALTAMTGVSILAAIWAAVLVVITGSLAWSTLVVRRIVRQARPLDTNDWRAPLWEIADRLELEKAPRLLRSEEAKMPFACGVLNPTIVLPAECDAWSLDRRRAVLLHELAHVRRHDLVGHTLGRLACALYWFHPLVWTAAKRLRSESERACDDLALACGTRATDYAEHLLEIVTSVRRDATPSVALAMARRKEFEGRMLAILDPELRHSSPSRSQSASLIAALALISLVVGAAAPARRVEPESIRDVGVEHVDPQVQQDREWTSKLGKESVKEKKQEQTATSKQTKTVTDTSLSETRQLVIHDSATPDDSDAAERALSRVMGEGSLRGLQKASDDRPALLAKVLRTDTSATLRRIAAWGLSEYADVPVATQALIEALKKDSDLGVREMAAWALGEGSRDGAGVSDALAAALRDPNVKVRQTAAWALGETGSRGAIDALVAALADSDAGVRQRALWAIGEIGPKQAPKGVVDKLKDKDPEVRELAAWALYEIEDPSVAPALEVALRAEQDKDLQLAYIRALAALGEKSVDALRGLLESPDSKIKSMAVRALAGGNAAGPWPWPWPEPRPDP